MVRFYRGLYLKLRKQGKLSFVVINGMNYVPASEVMLWIDNNTIN